MVDFIEEVEEQLRSDRYRAIAQRIWPWLAGLLGALILTWLAVWGYSVWRDRNIATASVSYDKAVTELSGGDQTGAYNDFAPIAQSGPAGYRTLSLMQQANIRLSDGKVDEAAKLFDAAARTAPNAIFRDLASLRAALALLDNAPYPQLETRLKTLIGANKPFDLQAREAVAFAKLAAGKTAEARNDFNALTLTLDVSQDMRERAQTAIAMIDSGQIATAVAAAKTAATMPPPKPGNLPFAGGAAAAPDTASSQGAAAPQDQGEPGSSQ